ncbi:hypothetical protein ACFL5J_01140 [Thermodesulfobacteriota bacterium]
MDYAGLFLANPSYCLVEKVSFSHSQLSWEADPNERVAFWVLRKDAEHAYREDDGK